MEIKGYITNLGMYNEGELVGKWITFPIDEDALNEILKDIGCCYYDEDGKYVNTGYEEYFFTDWDGEYTDLGEYVNIETVNELAEQLQNWEDDEDKFKAACEIWGFKYVIENSPEDYNLYSDIESEYDLGYYWAVDSGCYDLSKMGVLAEYINYDAFGRAITFETDGGFSNYGWIEYVR